MITEKIKNLFKFIEFLHSNIDNFKQYDERVNELYLLKKEGEKVRPPKNYVDKLKFNELNSEYKDKLKVIKINIIQPIRQKAFELIGYDETNETSYHWDGSLEIEISNIKENFNKVDLPVINNHIDKYIDYRTKTNCDYFQNQLFEELDKMLKEFFSYFKESAINEFKAFESKPIIVITPPTGQPQQGNKRGRKPIDVLSIENYIINLTSDEFFNHKNKLLLLIKEKFKNTTEPKKWIHVIIALKKLDHLKSATNKEYKDSFTSYFGDKFSSQTNFDNYFRAPDKVLLEHTENKIKQIIQNNLLV